MKKKILCVCAKGLNRSKYLAEYLKRKGYSTRYGGVETDYENSNTQKIITQEDANWADIIIFVRPRLEREFKEKYTFNGKIITINVTDSKRLIPEEYSHLRELSYSDFQKKWTRPQLRKAIKKYIKL